MHSVENIFESKYVFLNFSVGRQFRHQRLTEQEQTDQTDSEFPFPPSRAGGQSARGQAGHAGRYEMRNPLYLQMVEEFEPQVEYDFGDLLDPPPETGTDTETETLDAETGTHSASAAAQLLLQPALEPAEPSEPPEREDTFHVHRASPKRVPPSDARSFTFSLIQN